MRNLAATPSVRVDDEVDGAKQVAAGCRRRALRRASRPARPGSARASRAAADATLGVPMPLVRCRIWRCRLESSTRSGSMSTSVPTPAAARCSAAGQPSAPTPTIRTRLLRQARPRRAGCAVSLRRHPLRERKRPLSHAGYRGQEGRLSPYLPGWYSPAGISTSFPGADGCLASKAPSHSSDRG